MTDPAAERIPGRRGTGRPATEAGRARSGTSSRTDRGGAIAGSPPAGRAAGEPPARPPRTGGTGSKAGARTTETDKPGRAGKAARSPAAGAKSTAKPGRDRPAPVRGPGGRWPISDRSLLATVQGVPPIAAVGLAAALTAVGALVDLTRVGNLSTVFTICYISGCVIALAWVRRSGLFGPMVQPPLLAAAAVPAVVLLAGSPRPGQGVGERLLVIGAPLVNAFPVMAWASGAVLALGLLRIMLQRGV